MPLKTKGDGAYGVAAPYMLDVGISSTARIAQFWGLSKGDAADRRTPGAAPHTNSHKVPGPAIFSEARRLHGRRIEPETPRATTGLKKVIEDALRAAGLMK